MAKVHHPVMPFNADPPSSWTRFRASCERHVRLITFLLTAVIIVATISIINHFWTRAKVAQAYRELGHAATSADLLKLKSSYAGTSAGARILYRLGNAYYTEGKLEEAKKVYDEFRATYPESHPLYPLVRSANAFLEDDLKWRTSEKERYLNSLMIGTTPTSRATRPGPFGKSWPIRQDPPKITLDTSKGKFTAELFEDEVPNATAHLIKLIEKKTFDGARFSSLHQGERLQVNARIADVPYRIPYESSTREAGLGCIVLLPGAKPGETETASIQILTRPVPELNGKATVVGIIQNPKDLPMLSDAEQINTITLESKRNHPYEPTIIKE